MGRPVVLSNGQLFVGLNKHGLVHDFYYPYVGLDNLTTTRSERHKIGIWVDGYFSWVNDGTWEMKVDFEESALISSITMKNHKLGIELQLQDFVDSGMNAFCRHIKVINRFDYARDARLFMHQVFQISHDGRADTALFDPEEHYLLDYKGRCSLLIYAETSDGKPFDQYAVGNCGIEGKEGTFKDAEDGELSGNAVEHGGVDSVMRLSMRLGALQSKTVDYWIVAANSQQDAEAKNLELKKYGLVSRLRDTRRFWHDWMAVAEPKLRQVDDKYLSMTKKSMLVIKAHTDRRGSILASGDSSIFNYGRDYYCYCWPRDGAYAVWPLIRLGYKEEARNFFEFCRDIMHEDGYLMHKYQPDRAIGSTWHPLIHQNNRHELAIQEDETAIVIVMLGEYLKNTGDKDFVDSLYLTFIRPTCQFMAKFFDEETNLPHASYDLWEEKFLTTSYTVATTYAALIVASQFAEIFGYPEDAVAWRESASRIEESFYKLFNSEKGYFSKGYLLQNDGSATVDDTLDMSSFYGMMMFGPKGSREMVDKSVSSIESILSSHSPSGGIPRYEKDFYLHRHDEYLGNPWFICSFWLAQYYKDQGQSEKAHTIMDWASTKTLESGIFSEQIDPANSEQIGVSPLVWSHAEYINTALDLADI